MARSASEPGSPSFRKRKRGGLLGLAVALRAFMMDSRRPEPSVLSEGSALAGVCRRSSGSRGRALVRRRPQEEEAAQGTKTALPLRGRGKLRLRVAVRYCGRGVPV